MPPSTSAFEPARPSISLLPKVSIIFVESPSRALHQSNPIHSVRPSILARPFLSQAIQFLLANKKQKNTHSSYITKHKSPPGSHQSPKTNKRGCQQQKRNLRSLAFTSIWREPFRAPGSCGKECQTDPLHALLLSSCPNGQCREREKKKGKEKKGVKGPSRMNPSRLVLL